MMPGQMHARVVVVIAAAALVLAAPGAQAGPHHHKPPVCSLKGAHVLHQTTNKSIRILTRVQPADDSHDFDRQTLYGCMPRYRRIVLLNDKSVSRLVEPGNNNQFGGWTYNGSLIAYWIADRTHAHDQVGETWDRIEIYVKNLRTGRRLHLDHANGFNLELTKLALKPNGSLAYTIDQPTGLKPPFPKQVRKMDLDGHRVLDSQPGVDPASLTLSGSTVGWTRNGAPFTATIK